MNEAILGSEASRSPVEVPAQPQAEPYQNSPCPRPQRNEFAARLAVLDRVALLIGWGVAALGFIGAARMLVESGDSAASLPGGRLAGVLGAICMLGSTILAGLGVSSTLRVLVQWLSLDQLQREGDRATQLPTSSAHFSLGAAAAAPNPDREESLADVRRALRSREWDEAAALLDAYSTTGSDDPRLALLRKQMESAKEAVRTEQLAQLDAARQVSDPERVLELHQSLIPLLDSETRGPLEADLSRWFLRLIHNRLRTGRIQTELATLAGRIAESFGHTVEGASLRASLPTLRRSAGLCARCGQPYNGMANACPACLSRSQVLPTPPTAEAPGEEIE